MTAFRWLASVAVSLCLAWGVCAAQEAPPLLIATDGELTEYLARSRRLIDEGTYEPAIEILQSILSRRDVGFVSTDSRHFSSLRREVSLTIGQLPPEGLALYRALYDPPAESLYQQAITAGDVDGLAKIADQYLHTAAGAKALDALAQHAFDHARFAQAGRYWAGMLELDIHDEAVPLTLARMAVAYHFALAPAASDEALRRLESEYRGAQAAVGGSQRPLGDFVRQMRQRPVRAGTARALTDWPGPGGVPGGVGVMADCPTPEAPTWRYPADQDEGVLVPVEAALAPWQDIGSYYGPYGNVQETAAALKIRDGQALAEYTVGDKTDTTSLPAMVQPVLVGDVVVFRDVDKIIALDIRSGEHRWEVAFAAEILPDSDNSYGRHYGYYPQLHTAIYDSGYYSLTVADDMVFAIGESLSAAAHSIMTTTSMWNDDPAVTSRPTVLSAFSVSGEGKEVWSTRSSGGEDAELRGSTFISPPTVQDGRLYVVAISADAYYVYCLNASSGSKLWRSYICQRPIVQSEWGWQLDQSLLSMLYRASPPVVAEGRVAVLTNSGAVAAFDAETGRGLWAYQYDSRVNNKANMPSDGMMMRPPRAGLIADNIVRPPVNPVIMTGSRLFVLPADGEDLLCLSADTGRPMWRRPRHGLHHLAAIDNDRMLLSRPGVMICSAADGEALFEGSVSDVVGRPAVTASAVLLSGRGRLYRLDVSGDSIDESDLTSTALPAGDAISGNLITAVGRVISANALGVCSYADCDAVRAEITGQLASAPPSEQVDMYYERGWLAMYARRYEEAYEDFLACSQLAERLGVKGPGQLRGRLYLSCVGRANQADDPQRMIDLLELADTYTNTDQERAHNALRQAKYYESVGDFETAATLAHEIVDRYGDQALVDVAIGPAANAEARFTEDLPRVPAAELIYGRFLLDMIRKHGREAYAAFDSKAQASLASAKAAGDTSAMLAVAHRWPNSAWADDALYAAAETYYIRAGQADGDRRGELFADACRALARVVNWPDSPLAAPAEVALAAIYARQGKTVLVADACRAARDLARRTAGDGGDSIPVSFADVQGTVGELTEAISAGRLGSVADVPRSETLNMPVFRRFAIPGQGLIVEDGHWEPLLIDGDVLLVTETYLLRVDPSADDAASAVRWKQELPELPAESVQPGQPGPPVADKARRRWSLGVLDVHGRALAVADAASIVGVDVATGEVRWQTPLADLSDKAPVNVSGGGGVVLMVDIGGGVHCVNVADGQVAWRSSLGADTVVAVTVHVAGQVAVVEDRYSKVVRCYDLRADGKELRAWQGESAVSVATMGDSMIVVMVDGELAAYDASDLDQAIWERRFPADSSARVLGAWREGVVVAYAGRGGCRIEVLSTRHGQTTSRAETASVGGKPTAVVTARLVAEELYVFCTPAGSEPPAPVVLMAPEQRVLIQKFDLTDHRMLWQRDYTPESPGRRWWLRATLTDEYLLTGFGDDGRAYVLSLADGRCVAGGRFESVMARPAVVAGRLIVPEKEGVVFYGPR